MSPISARSSSVRAAVVATAALGLLAGSAATAPAGQASISRPSHAAGHRRACPATHSTVYASCMALIRSGVRQHPAAFFGSHAPTGVGYGPNSFQSAYKLPSATAGAGETVAVIEAFNDPRVKSDLAAYRKAWGQPACNTSTGAGCLTVVNQNGQTSPLPRNSGTSGWATEESLDVDMVSATCPLCKIIAVEASAQTVKALGTADDAAVSLGADFVSNSWGVSESSGETANDHYFNHPGVAVVVSAGDSGYGVSYPSSYPYAHTGSLFDITSGSNGSCSPSYLCTAGTGYDGPAGWGSPDGTAAFTG